MKTCKSASDAPASRCWARNSRSPCLAVIVFEFKSSYRIVGAQRGSLMGGMLPGVASAGSLSVETAPQVTVLVAAGVKPHSRTKSW